MDNEAHYTKYTYKKLVTKKLLEEATLNKIGSKGWRMVSVVKMANGFIYYFVKEEVPCLYLNDGEIMDLEEENK